MKDSAGSADDMLLFPVGKCAFSKQYLGHIRIPDFHQMSQKTKALDGSALITTATISVETMEKNEALFAVSLKPPLL